MCARGVDGTRDERETKKITNNTEKMNKNGHNDNDDQGTRRIRDEGEEKATHTAAGQGRRWQCGVSTSSASAVLVFQVV